MLLRLVCGHTTVGFGLIAALAISGAACGTETGIVVEVTRDEGTTGADIDTLRFFVGVEGGENLGTRSYFVDDANLEEDLVALDGRDLLVSPYKLLLRRGQMGQEKLMVAVLGLTAGEVVAFGILDDPVPFIDGKVLRWPLILRGDRQGRIDVTDTNCLFFTDDAGKIIIAAPQDLDCDGDPASLDCDDTNPSIGPSSPEVCDNNVDDNCDGVKDEEVDEDNDGVTNCDGDCDDTDDRRAPGKLEICDGVDNDCNDVCDDGQLDADDDKYTVCSRKILPDGTCTDELPSLNDCDDDDETINPAAVEICDGIDNNCDTHCDEGLDPDGDTFTSCGSIVDQCQGTAGEDVDCGPDNKKVFPGAPERCDGVDNDCDGVFYPDTVACYGRVLVGEPSCQVGVRTCGDRNGMGWISECALGATDPAATVPIPMCDKYMSCDMNGAPDPFACANDAIASTHVCTVYYTASNELCPNAEAALPSVGGLPGNCSWDVRPATIDPRYEVVLRDAANGSAWGISISVCDAVVVVKAAFDAPPVADRYLVRGDSAGLPPVYLRVDLEPMKVAACPALGMSCVGLAAPVVAAQR